jgi:hypothetical protein
MRPAHLLCVLAALTAAACHDLPDLGACNNGIVEEANGEACDDGGESSTCTAGCLLKCVEAGKAASYVSVGVIGDGPDAREVFCPDARYHCGSDVICRAPSGAFAPLASSLPFNIGSSPVLGDVDNDGLLDLVGTSPTQIYIRFASTSGTPLGDAVVQDAPSAEAPYVIFDRDESRRDPMQSELSIGIPTEGLALLRSDGERFAPELKLEIEVPGDSRGLVVRDPDPRFGEVVVAVPNQGSGSSITPRRVKVQAPRATDPPVVPEQPLPVCDGGGGQPWSTVAALAAPDRRSFVLVIQRSSAIPPQPWQVCRYTQAGGTWTVAALALPSSPPPPPLPMRAPAVAVLANLDGDSCLELAVRTVAAPGFGMIDAAGPPGCGFAAGVMPLPFVDPSMGVAAGLLAAGSIIPGDPDELVLEGGVFARCLPGEDCGTVPVGSFRRIAAPTKVPWHAAAVVDLNGDGALDVVAARGGEPDLDIVRGGGGSANVYRASTDAQISDLVAGDFDGDRLGDVAMVESNPQLGDRISVLFGTHEATVGSPRTMSGPTGQLVLGRFSEIPWIRTKGTDGVDDLFVVNVGAPTPIAGLAIGDAARLMTTPRFPPSAVVGVRIGALAAGSFTRPGGAAEVMALISGKALIYDVMTGTWAYEISTPMGLDHPPLAALHDGQGGARVVSGGPNNQVTVFSVRDRVFTMCKSASAAGMPVVDVRGIDIDGDGLDEVVAQYQGAGRFVQVFRVTGSPPSCSLEPVLADVLDGCADLANVGGRLVAICRPGAGNPARDVFVITPNRDGRFERAKGPVAQLPGNGHFVAASDFDGDGVPDVAIGTRRIEDVSVQFLRQCPAHDTRGCQR